MKIFINENLDYLRRAKNMTQVQVCKFMGWKSTKSYHEYISKDNPTMPSVETAAKFSRCFDVSLDDLVFKDLTK
ncbi:helix-turn-helix transcriptional regulator [Mycoplasmatota bacterium zrk1]